MPSPNVVDIEVMLKDWAWGSFLKSGKDAQKHKFNDINLEVKWGRVEFVSLKPEYINKMRNVNDESQVVFQSTYENLTSNPQDNSFTTERTTTSTCTTIVEQGFTKGMSVELKLTAPGEIMEVTTGFGKEIHLNKGTEETQERSLTWTANTSIRVKEMHRVKASLVVQEASFTARFHMNVRISGRAVVVLTNMKDNNSFLYCVENDISQILYDKLGNEGYITRENKQILWSVEGSCSFCYGIKQHVRIEEEAIDMDDLMKI